MSSTGTSFSTGPGNKNATNKTGRPHSGPATFKRPTFGASPVRFENQYAMKKRRYVALTKELLDKQKIAQELYKEISQLREKVISCGSKDPGELEDLKFEIGSLKQAQQTEIQQKPVPSPREKVDEPILDKPIIGPDFIISFEKQLKEVPIKSRDLCREILEQQSVFFNSIESRLKDQSHENNEETNMVDREILMQLEGSRKNNEALAKRLEVVKALEVEQVDELVKNLRELYEDYQNSYHRHGKEQKGSEQEDDLEIRLNTALNELQMEQDKTRQDKERMRQTETQLQRSRTKIRELEAHIASDEGKMTQLQNNARTLEMHVKQKDQAMEQRLRDMQKTMKNSEALVAKVEKQRDSFETRMMELKDKMKHKDSEVTDTVKELSNKLTDANNAIKIEKDKSQELEGALAELTERYKTLEDKSKLLCELAEKNKDFAIVEGDHTENEAYLFNELKATRAELEDQKEKMLQLQEEKEEIIAVMHRAAVSKEEDDSKEKLAAELVQKSNELQNLVVQYTELKKIAKDAQERSGILENQLKEIKSRLNAQSKEGGNAAINARAIEFEQQVSDLRNNLAEVLRQKKELETSLTQKQLELEQRDRVMREQNHFLKVRDELLGIMKGKNQDEKAEISTSDENIEYMDQITAKTEAMQDLYSTLEGKQLQIMRLEKLVKLMEDQQDRAQAQRTRMENRIAQLELALHKCKEYRGKGYGIL